MSRPIKRMRLIILFPIAAAFLALFATPVLAVDGKIFVGNHVLTENFRHKSEGYYLPLCETADRFGMKTEMKGDRVFIQDTIHGDIRIPTNERNLSICGETIDIGCQPIIRDGKLYFPAAFFEKVLGLAVHVDEDKASIYVSRLVNIAEVAEDGVAIDYKYPLTYTDFEIDDGESLRLVVDLDAAVLDGGLHQCSDVADDFLNFRAAQFTRMPDVVRIVLELPKDHGLRPKYQIDSKPGGLWIGLRPDAFKVEIKGTDDGCVAEISKARYEKLEESLLREPGRTRLVLDFIDARFPRGLETTPGIGVVSRVRIADREGSVRVVFDLLGDPDYSVEELDGRKVRVTFKGTRGDLEGLIIVIDPGHGGRDPGAVKGPLQEKALNLEMSLTLAEELRGYGAKVFLTRSTDIYLSLDDRLEYAKRHGADVFVVVHTNATRQPETDVHGPMIILDESCTYRDLLSLIYEGMVVFGGREGLGLRLDDRGLYLLRHRGDLTVVFIEVAFMTNTYDLRLLSQPEGDFKRNIMHGVAQGMLRYFTADFTSPPHVPQPPVGFDSSIFCLVDEEGLIDDQG